MKLANTKAGLGEKSSGSVDISWLFGLRGMARNRDVQMPNMNGLELIKRIREERKYDHIAILANTQYGDVTQEEVLLRAGADDFVYKPTTPTIVTTRLKNVLKNNYY